MENSTWFRDKTPARSLCRNCFARTATGLWSAMTRRGTSRYPARATSAPKESDAEGSREAKTPAVPSNSRGKKHDKIFTTRPRSGFPPASRPSPRTKRRPRGPLSVARGPVRIEAARRTRWRDPRAAWSNPAFTFIRRGGVLGATVATERFRYAVWDDANAELYDHAADPGENRTSLTIRISSRTGIVCGDN